MVRARRAGTHPNPSVKLSVPDILRLVIAASAAGLVATLVSEAGPAPSPLLSRSKDAGAELAGTAQITDGDTIEVAGTRVRLWGIDAPEHDQTCQGMRGETTPRSPPRRPDEPEGAVK